MKLENQVITKEYIHNVGIENLGRTKLLTWIRWRVTMALSHYSPK